jgi:hypothetical protein
MVGTRYGARISAPDDTCALDVETSRLEMRPRKEITGRTALLDIIGRWAVLSRVMSCMQCDNVIM